jgi:hypothetical protein
MCILIIGTEDQPRGQVVRISDYLIMRYRVQFLVPPWGIFLEGEDSHGGHGLGSLVELRFKAPPEERNKNNNNNNRNGK